MRRPPYSKKFDDIYFSAENGLAETQHVFLNGNNLPNAWENKQNYMVAETGFGTGLNFLALWDLFEQYSGKGQQLDFISVEKYPLTPDAIREGLMSWQPKFADKINRLLARYPLRVSGFHRIKLSDKVTLTLIFDDVNIALSQLEQVQIDCWFLDGFTPAKNPDMWREELFQNMARLSHCDTTYATFTAAGQVRRGLEKAGFSVEKKKGFGKKREMIVGRFMQAVPHRERWRGRSGAQVAVVGGGLAGTACAYILKQYGFSPVIYEQADEVAVGASGNAVGLYNPRFTAQRDAVSDFFISAYAQFYNTLKCINQEADVGFDACGALHLINSPEKEKRFHALKKCWDWHEDHMSLCDSSEASEIAGIKIDKPALYLPDAGYVSPKKLCEFYARDVEVRYNSQVKDLSSLSVDFVVICNAYEAKSFQPLSWLPIHTVRGQITHLSSSPALSGVRCNIQYGGYLSPQISGNHVVGATFQRWQKNDMVQEGDNLENIDKMKRNLSVMAHEVFDVSEARASMRTASQDHFPVVGQVLGQPNTYVATAFGSHGLVGSIMAAHLIADKIRKVGQPLPVMALNALDPARFIIRAARKGKKL